MAKQKYTLGRVFVGGKPVEDLTPEEYSTFQRRVVERMGEVLNNYFSHNPEAYVRIIHSLNAANAATEDKVFPCVKG